MMSGSSSAGPYSRRSSRTERSFDDPIREMEGMLVDEYGRFVPFYLGEFWLFHCLWLEKLLNNITLLSQQFKFSASWILHASNAERRR